MCDAGAYSEDALLPNAIMPIYTTFSEIGENDQKSCALNNSFDMIRSRTVFAEQCRCPKPEPSLIGSCRSNMSNLHCIYDCTTLTRTLDYECTSAL